MLSKKTVQHIQSLIAKNKIAEALKELQQEGINVSALQGRWEKLTKQMINRTEPQEYYDRMHNQIVHDTLELLNYERHAGKGNSDEKISTDKSNTYYEKLQKTLKNNKWVASLLIIIPVLVYLTDWGTKIKNLLQTEPVPKSCLIVGYVVENDSSRTPIEGVQVKIKESSSSQAYTKKDGKFVAVVELTEGKYLSLEFLHEKYKSSIEPVWVDVEKDTFLIQEHIRLTSWKIPLNTSKPSSPILPSNTFALLFRGEPWDDGVLIEQLEERGYQLASTNQAKNTIEILFPKHAISKNAEGNYRYDKRYKPQILVNQQSCETSLQLATPRWAQPEPELNEFLKLNLDAQIKNSQLIEEIIAKL